MTCETVNLREASTMLGLNKKTLLRLADAGELPRPLNLSTRKYLWSKRALLDYLSGSRACRFAC
jgi:predicted DNA-binding transcriptional regulator AlpA